MAATALSVWSRTARPPTHQSLRAMRAAVPACLPACLPIRQRAMPDAATHVPHDATRQRLLYCTPGSLAKLREAIGADTADIIFFLFYFIFFLLKLESNINTIEIGGFGHEYEANKCQTGYRLS